MPSTTIATNFSIVVVNKTNYFNIFYRRLISKLTLNLGTHFLINLKELAFLETSIY